MVGAQGLIEGVTGGESIVGSGVDGVMMIVRVDRLSSHAQQQRRGGAVEGLHPGSSVVSLVILIRLGTPIGGGPVGGILRGVCRVFVNVCEVREWSGPGVAA